MSATRVATMGVDHQIHLVDTHGHGRRPLTLPKVPSALARWGSYAGAGVSSWPCWSPDGRWIACFQAQDEEQPANVVAAVEVDGVEERELIELDGRSPLYCRWHPGGRMLAVLTQSGRDLELGVCDLDQLGGMRTVQRGVPLFFAWAPEGRRLLMHAGDEEGGRSRLLLLNLDDDLAPAPLPDAPGSFCAPVYAGGRPVYVSHHLDRSWVSVARRDGRRAEALAAFDGLLAVLPDPKGGRVVVGSAPRGEGTAYDGLWLVPLDGGPVERLTDDPCMAFFWDPTGGRLICASVDFMASCLRWRLLDLQTRQMRELSLFWPSRELLFYLHFFEQFADSHRLISADGRTLVYASYAASEQGTPDGARCHVLALDLDDPDPQPRVLGEGSFGVCAPV